MTSSVTDLYLNKNCPFEICETYGDNNALTLCIPNISTRKKRVASLTLRVTLTPREKLMLLI